LASNCTLLKDIPGFTGDFSAPMTAFRGDVSLHRSSLRYQRILFQLPSFVSSAEDVTGPD